MLENGVAVEAPPRCRVKLNPFSDFDRRANLCTDMLIATAG
jgi:hypothetical protein